MQDGIFLTYVCPLICSVLITNANLFSTIRHTNYKAGKKIYFYSLNHKINLLYY